MLWITLVLFIVGEAVADDDPLTSCLIYYDSTLTFDISKFMGTWYLVATDSTPSKVNPFSGSECIRAEYTLAKDGSFAIKHTGIALRSTQPLSTSGIAYPTIYAHNGLFRVTYFLAKNNNYDELYQVIDTNYQNWVLATHCSNFGKERNARIYTRTQNPPASVLEAAYKAATASKQRALSKTDQRRCRKV